MFFCCWFVVINKCETKKLVRISAVAQASQVASPQYWNFIFTNTDQSVGGGAAGVPSQFEV
jgi:hypothetical protein